MDDVMIRKEIELIKKHISKLEQLLAADELPPAPKKKGRDPELFATAAQVIAKLNDVCGMSFRLDAKKNVDPIIARLNEGFTFENFVTVIKSKADEWGKSEKMCHFLRPETLFGPKFEQYLQTAKPIRDKSCSYDKNEIESEILRRLANG